jgi:hypothetical protein
VHARYLYFAHEGLSPAELSAARLDGHLVELGEGYIPADAVETPGLRAASLAVLLGGRLAATHVSAAWVHGALDEPPARHTVQRAVPQRIHHVLDHRLAYRDTSVEPRDLARIGGVLVTRRARTLADLARLRAAGDRSPEVWEAARRLALRPGAAREAIICLALQNAVVGKPDALSLLRRWEREGGADQDDVTR